MNDDILIINGKKYVHTPEVKEKRREHWFIEISPCYIEPRARMARHTDRDIETVEIREGEIVVSEDDAFLALSSYMHSPYLEKGEDYNLFLKCLGF